MAADSSSSAPVRVLIAYTGPMPAAVDAAHGTFPEQIADCLACAAASATVTDAAFRIRTADGLGQWARRAGSCEAAVAVSAAAATGFGELAGRAVELDTLRLYGDDGAALPEDTADYACVIFSGSVLDVTMRQPWMLRAADWIRRRVPTADGPAAAPPIPMLGICFGHQLIAFALGGEVAPLPAADVGHCTVAKTTAAEGDPLLARIAHGAKGRADELTVVQLNGQAVLAPPTGAAVLMTGAVEPAALIRFAPCVYGTQFHPEFTGGFVRDLLPELSYGPKTPEAEADVLASLEKPTAVAASLVPAFVALALESRTSQ